MSIDPVSDLIDSNRPVVGIDDSNRTSRYGGSDQPPTLIQQSKREDLT